ncbi:hypothetical protein [Novosphingopyxis sp.]|uniref:hypothetical protein n=1 Tax=Novosphingopyxis sp. TaxID=2709690 RepID=UPI003B5C9BA2
MTATRSPFTRTLLAAAAPMFALAAPFGLTACGDKDANERQVAELDDQLSGAENDPALNAALNDRILVDPDLATQSNRNALRAPGDAGSGAVPPDDGYAGDKATLADLGGMKLLHAPAPRTMTDAECKDCAAVKPRTLGSLAERQARGTCDAKLSYGAGWANRMPAAFPVYPKGRVQEAAGVAGNACDIRVVSFTSANPMKDVVDYYYTRARGAGYDAEYVIRQGDHALGGTRGDDAYYITFAQRSDGGTAVDIVASGGS